jgi:ABC-type transport system substrate-binding protein
LQVQKDQPPRPVAASSAARPGGTVTVGIVAPTSIDPALVPPADAAGTLVVRTMCDSLLGTDPVNGGLRPDLVAGVQVGADGTIVTLRLRRGLRFSDGRLLSAADVVAALTRVARPEVASPRAAALRHVFGYQQLQQDETKAHGRLAGLAAPDPRTVQIALTTPDSGWVRELASVVGVPIPRRYARDNGFGAFSAQPVCVGPYRLSGRWRPADSSITLVRARGYDGGNPGDTLAGRGWADRIVFRIYASQHAAYDAYLHGEVDLAQVPSGASDVATRRLGVDVAAAENATLGYIGLPVTRAPFDDPVVRRALSMAIDRRAIVRDVYHGGRTPAQGLYPPVVGDDVWRPAACGRATPVTADAAGARALLGPRLASLRHTTWPVYVDDEFANKALMTQIAAQWHRALGISVRLVGMNFADYLPKATQAPGFDGPFRLSYASAASAPSDYVRDLLTSASVDTSNATRFVDRGIEQVFSHEASTHFGARGDAGWRAIEQRFCAQLPLIPLTFNDQVWAWRATVGAALGHASGHQLDRATGLPLLRECYRRTG